MIRQRLLFLLSATALLCCCWSCADSEPKPPNVLFIIADDLGANDLGFCDPDFYETPNIDALAYDGTIFTDGYAAAAVCSPSRASIMLGQSTAKHGITDWIGARSGQDWARQHPYTRLAPPSYGMQLDTAATTLAEHFQAAGYRTFFAGKWHLGPDGSWPDDHGFDINAGGWDSGSPAGGYFTPYRNPNLADGPVEENLSMRLAKETTSFLQEQNEGPFFAFLSFYAVHGPIQTTKAKWQKYRQKATANGIDSIGFEMERRLPIRKQQDNPIYAGLVEQMDDAIGLVIEELKQLGLYENTIIVFTSDNGGVTSGDAFSTSNRPLRGGKGYQWEGGIRVPFVIKSSQGKGSSINYPVSGQDFLPTLIDLCSLSGQNALDSDGINLAPLLNGGTLPARALYWHYPHYGNQGGDPASMVREGNYKLIYYWETNEIELYNLLTDPGESANIASEQVATARQLQDKLFSWLTANNARFPNPSEAFSEQAFQERRQYILDVLGPNLEAQRHNQLSETYEPNPNWWGSQTVD